ncbi:MAG TPA: alpha-(1-_3)-arabinofuranosyltransferase family protein [Acidimicrobiales bacterium]|nr:alpha-(1->3)-arabinofuranosyltransferase family protein [Acidimicrobiales bacterium]
MRYVLGRVARGARLRRPAFAAVAAAPAAPATPSRPARTASRARRRPSGPAIRLHAALAAVIYLPLLVTQPGWISADTKTYLYLDPSKLMSRAWSMWDPSIGLGTVTHQNVGYLWPMGPFYWLADRVGLPDWTAQRLWWGTIMFLAGAGVAYLLRTLGWKGPGVVAATFGYALTPFVLTLVARLSAILLPFTALPWLVALIIRTTRTRGWRYPALFALAVTTCGSVNATALLLVGVAPALWLAHAVWVAREISLRTAVRAALRLGVLTVPVSAWWIAGLSVQGTNGIEILRYTETARTVASVSVSHEVLRGLGYWFFYGGDRLGPWIEPSVMYTQFLPLLAFTYLLPIAGLLGGVVARWRHRAYFVMLLCLGTALAVGAFPWEDGSPWSRGVKAFVLSDVGLSMRSLPRAVPLVALSLAVLAGAGVTSAARRWPRSARPLTYGVVAVTVLALPPLWLGDFVPENLRRPESVPDYWRDAADHLDAAGADTRVLVVPGTDFASYRWGNTVDPILPGLIDRPSVQRELIPYGSAASANLLNAFDLGLQERTADPDSLAAVARLMRAGDVLVQSDLQYERYNTPRPRNFWAWVLDAPGLGTPTGFGPAAPNLTTPEVQLDDEVMFESDPSLADPHEVAVLPVTDPVGIVSTHATASPLIVAGDGAGLVDGAAAGLIDGRELIRYSAALSDGELADALDDGAALLVTDSNRKRGERWTTIRHTRGYTETTAGEPLVPDSTDNRLPLFPDAGTDAMTVATERSGISAQATTYGNPITFTSEERATLAVDGDIETAWRTAAFSDARGERLDITLDEPVTTDRVNLTQVTTGARNRYITKVRLRFDGGDPVDLELTAQSRDAPGQLVTFPERTFSSLSVEILADSVGWVPRYAGQSSVGFAEIAIGDEPLHNDEAVRLPTDLLDAAGDDSLDHPVAFSLTRQRQDPADTTRLDEEMRMVRVFSLPTDRSFSVTGEARLYRRFPNRVLDATVGRPHDGSVTWARASSQLTASTQTASAAFDGDPSTAWTTIRSDPDRQWVEINLTAPVTVSSVPLTIVADGRHSVPTEVEVWVDGVPSDRIGLPAIDDGAVQNATTTVDVPLPAPVTGSTFRIRITAARTVTTHDWVSDHDLDQPAAIAEIGLPAPPVPPLPETFDSGCRSDLLTVDGTPLPVRVTGPMVDALAGEALDVVPCDGAAVSLAEDDHEIATALGRDAGLEIDRLVLRSAAGGAASGAAGTLVSEAAGGTPAAGPSVRVVEDDHDRTRVEVEGATPGEPFWLVLGQSLNPGWAATVDGDALGAPRLVDGFANGWLVTPDRASFTVALQFTPQRRVDLAIIVSVVAALACLALAVRRPRVVVRAPDAMAEPYSSVLAFRYDGALPSRRRAVWTGVGVGVFAWLLAGPGVGVVVGLAAGLGARHETFRRYLLLASPAALGLCALYVLYIQTRWDPEPSFDWPIEMKRPHPIGWAAVLLLVADVVVDRVWQGRRPPY